MVYSHASGTDTPSLLDDVAPIPGTWLQGHLIERSLAKHQRAQEEMRKLMGQKSLLNRCRIVPVVVIHHADHALPLGEALLAGGIDVVEITLRTPAGFDAIRTLAASPPDLQVGAGWSPTRSIRSPTPAHNSSSAPDCASVCSLAPRTTASPRRPA